MDAAPAGEGIEVRVLRLEWQVKENKARLDRGELNFETIDQKLDQLLAKDEQRQGARALVDRVTTGLAPALWALLIGGIFAAVVRKLGLL